MTINYSSPINFADFVCKAEFVLAGYGVFSLLIHRDSPSIAFYQLELDGFQSCCQRDWLSLRWGELLLRHSAILVRASKRLVLLKELQAEEVEAANAASLEGWANSLAERITEISQARK